MKTDCLTPAQGLCFETTELSLLDTAGAKVLDWYVVYFPRTPHFWFAKHLKQGFRHVELARSVQYGPNPEDVIWLHVLPTFETLDVEVALDSTPPWIRCPDATCQRVRVVHRLGAVRSWFDIGPPTCVEIVKTALGIRAFWVRTPYQLYKYINRRCGAITR